MYPTHAGLIGCIIFTLWPHKYKVGHIDLILIYHHNLLNSPEIPEFSCVSHKVIVFLFQPQQCQLSHCSALIMDIYLHYQVQGYIMRVNFTFLVQWHRLIFQCRTVAGSH